ncbi:hypothetical protein KCH_37260 [Kitasatospora cheerisanensis KCTC 2395]|uniref:Uncharacterized protein n=1 Tax=Kitasatospora cheerisanensis KCTC 2395 TaxID=1348663 RepID=A0A066YXC2_9ACTN|nr:hypothetical protein KCH_37260 [Kitasatospora cheerisanensis KCTC 2395]
MGGAGGARAAPADPAEFAGPGGRALAGAAPFVLAGGAALGAAHLVAGFFLLKPGTGVLPVVAAVALSAPWVLALLGAALGRWAVARVFVLVAVVAVLAAVVHPVGPSSSAGTLLELWCVMGGLVLLAPPDGVDLSRRGRSRAVACSIAVGLPMCGIAAGWLGLWLEDYPDVVFPPSLQVPLDASTAWPAVVLAVAYLLHLADPRVDRVQAGGVALAVLPWVVMPRPPLYYDTPLNGHDLLRDAAVVLALLAAATAAGVLRRRARLAGTEASDLA